MSIAELLSHISALDSESLMKVRKTVDMLLAGTDEGPSTWDGYVWDAVRKSLSSRGLRMPAFSAVQSNPDKRRRLASGAEDIRVFIEHATGQQDEHRLRTSLPFVVETAVRLVEKGQAPMLPTVILNRLPDFPAYVVNAFPGCNASPSQFLMVRSLFSKSSPVS
tara:strand:+ start:28257 stop:28748 length:492 start_codon:yes stop_codon:yes gene_type:complete